MEYFFGLSAIKQKSASVHAATGYAVAPVALRATSPSHRAARQQLNFYQQLPNFIETKINCIAIHIIWNISSANLSKKPASPLLKKTKAMFAWQTVILNCAMNSGNHLRWPMCSAILK